MAQCYSCGFLSKKAQGQQERLRYFYEVHPEERDDPQSGADIREPEGTCAANWVCFRASPAFGAPITHGALHTQPREVVARLREELNCSFWMRYERGFEPKEHLTEKRLADLESDRRNFQIALSSAGKSLTYAALILAAAQVFTMTPDSLLYKLGASLSAAVRSLGAP